MMNALLFVTFFVLPGATAVLLLASWLVERQLEPRALKSPLESLMTKRERTRYLAVPILWSAAVCSLCLVMFAPYAFVSQNFLAFLITGGIAIVATRYAWRRKVIPLKVHAAFAGDALCSPGVLVTALLAYRPMGARVRILPTLNCKKLVVTSDSAEFYLRMPRVEPDELDLRRALTQQFLAMTLQVGPPPIKGVDVVWNAGLPQTVVTLAPEGTI